MPLAVSEEDDTAAVVASPPSCSYGRHRLSERPVPRSADWGQGQASRQGRRGRGEGSNQV